MSTHLIAELYVPREAGSHESILALVNRLLALGLLYEDVPGMGTHYFKTIGDTYDQIEATSLDEALQACRGADHWGMLLFRHTSEDEQWGCELHFSVTPRATGADSTLAIVSLSLPTLPQPDMSNLGVYDYFRSVVCDVAESTNAEYG